MDQRACTLVTRCAALLILALFAAPVWDAWRYSGLATSGGAAFPVGAIMPGRRPTGGASTAQPAGTTVPSGVLPTLPADPAPTIAAAPGAAAGAPSSAPIPQGASPSGSVFEAWSARAQIDPFWDGVTTTRRPVSARAGSTAEEAGDPRQGRDEVAGTPAQRGDKRAARRAPGGTGEPGRQGQRPADGVDGDSDTGTAPQAGEAAQDGLVAGAILLPAATSSSGITPTPAPDPVNPPLLSPTLIPAPAPAPGDPEPIITPVPLVSALVAPPDVAPGDAVLVTIRIEDADRMTSLPFHLGFDPAVIDFEGSQPGSALAALEPILLASVSPNRPGDLAVGLSLVETVGVFTGTGDLVTLRFRALAAGASDLTFSRATLRGSRSQAIEVRFSDGAVTVH